MILMIGTLVAKLSLWLRSTSVILQPKIVIKLQVYNNGLCAYVVQMVEYFQIHK